MRNFHENNNKKEDCESPTSNSRRVLRNPGRNNLKIGKWSLVFFRLVLVWNMHNLVNEMVGMNIDILCNSKVKLSGNGECITNNEIFYYSGSDNY